MSLKQRIITLDFDEVMDKLANRPERGYWLLAIDPESLTARIVFQDEKGFVPDVIGHEDLFPLSMAVENQDGFLKGGDWLVASTPDIRYHDGEYRSYWIDWKKQDKNSMIDKAREFLKMARHDGIAAMTSYYPFIICYLSHQRCEKFFKAFLAYNQVSVPRTHDLKRLVQLCTKFDSSFSVLIEDLEILEPYAVEIRYSSDKSQAEQDCERVWNMSRKIGAFVKRRLPASLRKGT
jgi:HEPN domain-containing protein